MNDANLIEDLRLLSPPDYRWAVALVLGAAVLWVLTWWWRRLRRALPVSAVSTPPSGRPPWETALAELERLVPLLRPETARDYAIASTGVLRGYLEQRYGLRAPRLATEEFLLAASRAEALPSAHRRSLGPFLRRCDLLKFGRYTAGVGELGELHAAALGFVMDSRPTGGDALRPAEPVAAAPPGRPGPPSVGALEP